MNEPAENKLNLVRQLPRAWAVALILISGMVLSCCATGCFGGFGLLTGLSNTIGPMGWAPTPCVITAFAINTDPGDSNNPESTSSTSVEVNYTYVVNDRRFTGTRYSYDGNSGAIQVINQMKKGPGVCYVNPSHPESAVLVRGFNVHWAPMLVPAALIMTAVCVAAWKRWHGIIEPPTTSAA